MEEVQKSPNKAVYDYAVQILSKYFDIDDQMDIGANNGSMGGGGQ